MHERNNTHGERDAIEALGKPSSEQIYQEAILAKAKTLHIPLTGIPRTNGKIDYSLLNERCLTAEAAQRSSRMWWLALLSTVASAISAVAAWSAVYTNIN